MSFRGFICQRYLTNNRLRLYCSVAHRRHLPRGLQQMQLQEKAGQDDLEEQQVDKDRLNYGSYTGRDEDCIGDAHRTQGSHRFQRLCNKISSCTAARGCTRETTQLHFQLIVCLWTYVAICLISIFRKLIHKIIYFKILMMLILVRGFPSLQEGFPVEGWETGNSTDGSTVRVTTSVLHLL